MRRILLPLTAPLWAACVFTTERAPAPVVQRPTVSSNTRTTAPGVLGGEFGLQHGDDAFAAPATLRLGVSDRSEVFLDGDLYRDLDGGGSGVGDLNVGIRHRFLDPHDGRPANAFQLRTKLPTADDDVGTGAMDFGAAYIVDWKRGVVDSTLFYELGAYGDVGQPGTDVGHVLALAFSRPLDDRLGAVAEVAGQHIGGQHYDAGRVTLAGTYWLDARTLLDAGVALGFGDDAEDWFLFVGLGSTLGRLFDVRSPGPR